MISAEAKTVSGAVSEISDKVGTEGVEIILGVLGGLAILIALVIIFPRIKQLINKFLGKGGLQI